MPLAIRIATEQDAAAIAALRTSVANDLTLHYGRGHWAFPVSEAGALRDFRSSQVLVACNGADIVGTARLTAKKPWAIDPAYFTPVGRALYLMDMAVAQGRQRQGIGSRGTFTNDRDPRRDT